MFKHFLHTLDSIRSRDPAARSRLEVLLCYPGVHAVALHRVSHWLWRRSLKLPARLLAMLARMLTGIDIHPAATLGKRLFIDHGMGVVIGETARVGDDVTMYHDVTLGGTAWVQGVRHPQVGDGVIIGAGAQLLGPIHVGAGARVGANAVVVADVPPGATVVGVPARVVAEGVAVSDDYDKKDQLFTAYGTPCTAEADPVAAQLADLHARVAALEEKQRP